MLKRVRIWYGLLFVVHVINGVFLAEGLNYVRESIKHSPLFVMLHFISAQLLLYDSSAIKIFFFWLANFAEGGYSDLFPGVGVLDGDSLILVQKVANDTFCKSVKRLSQKDIVGWHLNDMYLQINSDHPNSERHVISEPK